MRLVKVARKRKRPALAAAPTARRARKHITARKGVSTRTKKRRLAAHTLSAAGHLSAIQKEVASLMLVALRISERDLRRLWAEKLGWVSGVYAALRRMSKTRFSEDAFYFLIKQLRLQKRMSRGLALRDAVVAQRRRWGSSAS